MSALSYQVRVVLLQIKGRLSLRHIAQNILSHPDTNKG